MRRFFRFIAVVTGWMSLLFAGTCPPAAGQVPSWIETGGIRQFPSELFISGLGSADVIYGDTAAAQAEADSKAMAQVAKQIRVKIRQISESFEKETSTAEGTVDQHDVWQKTAAFIDIRVEGVRIEDRHYDQKANRLYSLAVLDRLAQGRIISAEIDRLEHSADTLIGEARTHLNHRQKVHRSMIAYRLATTKLLLGLRKNQYLNLIAPQLTHPGISKKLYRLQSELNRFSALFDIRPVSGDRQRASIGGSLTAPITVRVTYRNQPAPSIPVAFLLENGSGHLDSQAVTDGGGLAATPVSNLGPTGKTINKIKALVDFYPKDAKLQRSLRNLLPPVEAQFSYFLPAVEDMKIAVLIQETNMGYRRNESILANLLTHEFSRSNFKVVEDVPAGVHMETFGPAGDPLWAQLAKIADIAVVGEVKSRLADDSYNPSLVFSRGRAVVRVVDLNNHTELGAVDISTKSAGPSREASGRRVIDKASRQAADRITQVVRRALLGGNP